MVATFSALDTMLSSGVHLALVGRSLGLRREWT